jgi:hypothetical protein
MSLRDDILAVLQADGQLNTLLPGGVYDDEITRQETPDAFDTNREVKPCVTIRQETETPVGPHETSARAFVTVYFYGNDDTALDAARARVFTLLHRQKVGSQVWQMEHVDDVLDQVDDGLGCGMCVSRYQVTRLR